MRWPADLDLNACPNACGRVAEASEQPASLSAIMDVVEKLLEFVADLEKANVHYTIGVARSEAVMVTVALPGERVEVEFFADGNVEIERFISNGTVNSATEADLRSLIADS